MSWRTAAARRALIPALATAVAIVLLIVGDDTLDIVGLALLGIATVLAVSLVFLEVGLSEDRDRERRFRG